MEDQTILAYDGERALTYSDLLEEIAMLKDSCETREELEDEVAYLIRHVYHTAYDLSEFI